MSYLILYFFFAQIKRTHPSSNKYITDNNLSIFDETDHFRLSIQINSLIMFESEDNYVKVYYEENNITKKDMIRITMQRIEELSTNLPYVRCHRRYIINRDKIIAIKKEGRLYKVSLKGINESIPVSRSYFSLIKQM